MILYLCLVMIIEKLEILLFFQSQYKLVCERQAKTGTHPKEPTS
jgi:hypothetical protein